jgi:hypothetical protein
MSDAEPIDLDDYLASRSFDVQTEKLKIYEAILGAMLRKYVVKEKKLDLNLLRAYSDTILDITISENGLAKVSWREDV